MHRTVLLCVAVLVCLSGVLGGQFIAYSYSGRNNYLWIPSAAGGRPLPLFVMLHGCTQNPQDFAKGTNMNALCDQNNCFVLYPEQPSSANINKCWSWFETSSQARGSGEPQLIVSMAQSLYSKYSIDQSRVFVGGLSAGAAMSVILGATYPDVFRGVTAGSGLEYKAATSMIEAYTAMSSGGPNPVTQGQLAYKASGGNNRQLAVLVTHGTSDTTVAPINGKQIVSQYATTLDYVLGNGVTKGYITDTPTNTTNGQVPGGRSYTTSYYVDKLYGHLLIQYIVVNGMAHAWSGGSSAGTYTDPKGPDASSIMIKYFYEWTNTTQPSTTASTTASASSTATTGTGSSTTSTSGTSTSSSSTTGGGNTITFTSIAGEDGYVGKLAANGYSTSVCQVGDSGMYNLDTYRTILSFDTTSLPPNAQITSAVLQITRVSLTGTLQCAVDIKKGTFGATATLTQSAYNGIPSASNIGTISPPSSDGASSQFSLPSSAFQYIFPGNAGRSQIMLREVGAVADFAGHLLTIVDGGATLTVTYH